MRRPKAWLPFAGEIMLQGVVRLLSEVVDPIIVVAAPNQELPPLRPGVLLAHDEHERRGPLEGMAAGLKALRGKVDAAYLSGCDVPFLQPAFVARLIELLGDNQICVPKVGEYHHPLAAIYRLEVLPVVERLLAKNQLRPSFLFEAVPTRVVLADELLDVDPLMQSVRNLNTPEDYQEAIDEIKS